jgi:WD40 repeat protein
MDQTIKVWNTDTGKEWFTIRGHTSQVYCLAFRPDGNRLVSGSFDGTVKIWDTTAIEEGAPLGTRVYRIGGPNPLKQECDVALSRDGRRLAAADNNNGIALWDTVTGRRTLFLSLAQLRGAPRRVALSPDGQRLASDAGSDKGVSVRSSQTGEEILVCRGHQGLVQDVAFSPDGRLVAAAAGGGVKLWDAASGKETRTLSRRAPSGLAFSPDGSRLASVSGAADDPLVCLWDVNTGEVVWRTAEKWRANAVAFSRDGGRLAVASDHTVRVLDARTGEQRLTLGGHAASVWGVAFHPEGERLAVTTQDGSLVLWDLANGREALTLPGGEQLSNPNVLFGPDGRWLVRTIRDGGVWLQDATPLPEQTRASP